jgi:hypothetical protein
VCLTLYSRAFGMQVVGDKAVIFGGCGVTKSNEPCVSNQTYYLHMSADPMKWEEADLMGDVPPPRWRHTATLLPDGVRSSPPSPRCSCRPDAIHPLLHLCLPAAFAHVAGQHHDVRWALQGQACRRPHSSHPPRPHRPHRPVRPRHPPAPAHPDARARLACSLRLACRRYNDVHVLSVEKNEWSIKECAGSLPQPRSHARESRRRPASASSGAAWLPRGDLEPAPPPPPPGAPPPPPPPRAGGRGAPPGAPRAPPPPPPLPLPPAGCRPAVALGHDARPRGRAVAAGPLPAPPTRPPRCPPRRPPPRRAPLSLCSHHTASTIVEEAEDELSQPTHKVFILGGYGGLGTSRDFFMDVHFLALDTWTWEKVPANTAFARRAHRALSPR